MTVASETNRSGPYNGNGVTTVFDYEFRIISQAHLRVIKAVTATGVEETLTLDDDYTVSGVGAAGGGQVTILVAPPAGQTITLLRKVPFVQETDLENQGAYYAETVETVADLAAMRDQELSEGLSRTLQVGPSQEPIGPLPEPSPGLALAWHATERKLISAPVAAGDVAAAVSATAADRVQTGLDRTQTGLDRTQTGLDRVQTGLDRTQTGLDRVQTGADIVSAAAALAGAQAARDASLYGKGIFPTTAAAIGLGVVGHGAITPGATGTDGTFDLAFTGGTGSGAAGRFVVSGGALTQILITAPGSYTVAPAFSFAASAGLAGAAAAVILGKNADVGEYFWTEVSTGVLGLYNVTAGPVATDTGMRTTSVKDIETLKVASGLPIPAVRLTEGTVTNTQHTFSRTSGAMTIGQVYSLTAVFKPGSNRSIQLASLAGTIFSASVNPDTLEVTTSGTLDSTTVSRQGDWITLTVTWTEVSAASRSLYVRLLNAVLAVTYVGDGASNVSLYSLKLSNVTTASTIWTVTTAAGGTAAQLTATDVVTAEDLIANRFIAAEDAVSALDVKLNGQATMAKLAENVGNVTPSISRTITVTAGLTARFEAIVKLASGDRRFGFSSVLSGGSMSAIFDLQDGVVETVASNCTATITHLGNDIYRCTLERVAVNSFSAAVLLQIWPVTGGPTYSNGDGVSGIYVQEFKFIRGGVTILSTTDFSSASGGWTETGLTATINQALYLDLEAPVRQITSINRKLTPSPRVIWWGDSLTEGSGSTGGQTPAVQLRTLLGRQVAAAGAGSQQSASIAARAGGRAALITVSGDQIPASGPVNITAYSVDIAYYAGTSYSVVGSLAGIPGTITKVTASGGASSVVSYTFTRTTAGVATRCLPDTPFIPSVVYPNRIHVIWIGRNDYGGLVGAPAFEAANTMIKDCIKSIISTIATLEKRAIILGVLPSNSSSEYVGTDSFNYKRTLARELARDYPNGFIDIDPILRSNGDGSPGDNTDIANGVTPGSLRFDGTHLNNTGYGIVAAEIKALIDRNGW